MTKYAVSTLNCHNLSLASSTVLVEKILSLIRFPEYLLSLIPYKIFGTYTVNYAIQALPDSSIFAKKETFLSPSIK